MEVVDMVSFIEDPAGWPVRPLLPLVLEDGDDVAYGLLVEGHGATVFGADLVDALQHWSASDREWDEPTRRWLAERSRSEFVSMAAVLDAGWEID